jgi:hypothetical protein
MKYVHKSTVVSVAFAILLALAACSNPSDGARQITSDEAVGTMDALADEVETELTGLEQDPDLVAVAGFFEGSTTVASAGALSPAQSTEPVELPRGVLAWSPDTGYKPDEAATPPSPYDLQVVGNPRDAGAELLVDWDAGSDTTQLTVGTTTIELPTDASAVARVDGDTVVEATFAASWELVAETRCGATARSLTATSLELEVTAGSRSLTVSATTTAASTSLSVELALGGIGAEVGFTIDEQIRILAEPDRKSVV